MSYVTSGYTASQERQRARHHGERPRQARPRAEGAARRRGEDSADRRRRQHDQAPHEAEPRQEHQGRHRRARGIAACVKRAAGVPGVRRADARGPQNARRRPQGADLPQVRGSRRQMTRLKEKYQKEVVPALQKEFGYKNVMAVPKIEKVVVNMGLGEATSNAKLVDVGADEISRITGQKPVTRRAKKSIAAFKVRKGMPIAAMVTLRGERMWEVLDRPMNIALPRVRDFKGVSPRGFDGRGNYTLGLRDQLLFPEIDYMKVDKARGMNVSVVTTAKTDEEARKLLQFIGMPFRQN